MSSHRANNPRVTWLLPVKNGQPFIERTLASIERQSCGDYQVLAWDNGSTDDTVGVLQSWIGRRLPGRVVTDRPMGLGASLAAMVDEADTPFCARIDADDVNEPLRLAAQLAFLEANPCVAVIGSAVRYIDEHDNVMPQTPRVEQFDADIRWRLRFCNALNHPTVLFRRDAILDAGNYRDIMPIEDYDLWVRVAMKYEMANIAVPLVRYRVLNQSVSAQHNDKIDAIRRQTILSHANEMFPGVEQDIVQRLLQLTANVDTPDVTRDDCRALHTAATHAAQRINKPADYFCNTQLYRTQRKSLRNRRLKSNAVINAAWSAVRGRRAA